jgi:hypothetical protein
MAHGIGNIEDNFKTLNKTSKDSTPQTMGRFSQAVSPMYSEIPGEK